MRIFSIIAGILAAAALPASAQTLLTNGDFEASGDIGFGNHIYFDIPGWEAAGSRTGVNGALLAWNRGNLVQVDGPGGASFNGIAPDSDADGGPSGTPMHYVDEYESTANGLIWQYFSPGCSGTVQGSAAFSNREGRRVPISLGIVGPITNRLAPPGPGSAYQGGPEVQEYVDFYNAFTTVAMGAELPGGSSTNYYWVTLSTNTTPVVAGQTYAFAARVTDYGNMDNAEVHYVEMGLCVETVQAQMDPSVLTDLAQPPSTLPPLTPSEISVTKTCEALEASVYNGVLGQNWQCSVDVTVPQAPFAGSLAVADLFSTMGSATGQVISSASQSGSFDCTSGATCLIDGADFDASGTETVNFDLFISSDTITGPVQLQNCATGSYSLNDVTSPVQGNCVAATWAPSSNAVKTCEPVVATQSGVMSLACQITVTGSNLAANSYVSLIDMFAAEPPAMATVVGPMTTITSSDPWSCIDLGNSGAAATLGACQLSTQDLFNAGGSSTIDMTFDFTTDQAPTQVANCPIVSVEDTLITGGQRSASGRMRNPDTGGWPDGMPDGCVYIDVPAYSDDTPPLPALENAGVTKTCDEPRVGQIAGINGYIWDCDVAVTLNPAPFAGSFTLTEDASQIINGAASFVSASLPCAGLGTDVLQCVLDGATATSPQTLTVQLFATPANPDELITWTNCARGETTQSDPQVIATPSCVVTTIKPDSTPPAPVIEVTKTCEAVGDRQNLSDLLWFQQMRCALTVITNGVPFTGPLWLTEELSYGPSNMNATLSGMTSSDPWQCTNPSYTAPGQTPANLPVCSILGSQFPNSAGSSTVYVDFMLFGAAATLSGASNCVGAMLGETPAATIADAQVAACTVILPAPVNTDPTLSITKTCEPAVQGTPGAWTVDCAVTVSGSNLPGGQLVQLFDEITSSATQSVWQGAFATPASWTLPCNGYGVPNGIGRRCDLLTDFITAQGGSVTIPYTAQFSGQAGRPLEGPQAQNCVYAELPNLSLAAPAGANGRVCVPIVFDLSMIIDPTLPVITEPLEPTRPVILDGGTIGSAGTLGGPIIAHPVGDPQIDISKTCEPLTGVGFNRQTSCVVTLTGTNLPSGGILRLEDVLSSVDPGLQAIPQLRTMVPGITCGMSAVPQGQQHACDIPTDALLTQGGTLTLAYDAYFNGNITTEFGIADAQNCVSVSLVGTSLRAPAGLGQQVCAPIEIREPRWTYTKTCAPLVYAAGAQSAQMHCTISVTGYNLTSANSLHLVDQLGYAGGGAPTMGIIGPFTNVIGATGWTCGAFGTWSSAGTCSVTGDVLNAAGGTMTFDWVAEVGPLAGSPDLMNCIDVRLDSLNQTANAPLVCAPIEVIHEPEVAGGVATFLATPEQLGPCRADRDRQVYDCAVGVTLENTGGRPYSGPLALLETFGAPGLNAAHLTSGGDVRCDGPVENAVTCAIAPTIWEPRDVRRIDLSLVVPGRRNGGQMQVCASLGAPDGQRQRVALVQTILNQRGFAAGSVDGLPGRRTYAALAQLQARLGLPESRAFDAPLMAALGLDVQTNPDCTQLVLPPMPAPPLRCDSATTIGRGDACACRYDAMIRRDATSCSCPRGTDLVRGEGCRRIETPAPRPAPDDAAGAGCDSGITINGACVTAGRPLLESLIPGLQIGN